MQVSSPACLLTKNYEKENRFKIRPFRAKRHFDKAFLIVGLAIRMGGSDWVCFNNLKQINMQVKYKAIRERLKNHIEDRNGEGTWKNYYGSQLEADIVSFVEEEVRNNGLLHNISETYTADQMRKVFFAGLFHDTVVDESEDGEAYETAYNDVMSRAKESSR